VPAHLPAASPAASHTASTSPSQGFSEMSLQDEMVHRGVPGECHPNPARRR
jgi:hypothetical protein